MIRTIAFSVLCGLLFVLPPGAASADFWSRSLASSAPFKDPGVLGDLERYTDLRFKKAFAVSVTRSSWGWSHGYRSQWEANRIALRACETRSGTECQLYAIGNSVVWDPEKAAVGRARALPAPARRGAVWRYYGEGRPHELPLVMPEEAPSIISDYRSARGVLGGLRAKRKMIRPQHSGIDILARIGTPVLAAADGVVKAAGAREVAGRRVEIAHGGSGEDPALVTRYLHLDEILVAVGDTVRRGQQIGTVGVSGKGAVPELPHLHFDTAGSNPHLYWHDGQGRITCFLPERTFAADPTALTYPLPCGATVVAER
ncbi:MAG: peptidoglycan DD-metalloendopeptidase family protein [Kiloniellales bacterium]|nr:peptidoglycan DD-metalloendopeptidase family protein [Kiloniellales bacterium]